MLSVKLTNRHKVFDDNRSLVEAAQDMSHELKEVMTPEQLYILGELIANASGLDDLAASAIRAVKALERNTQK